MNTIPYRIFALALCLLIALSGRTQDTRLEPQYGYQPAVWGPQFGWREDVSVFDAGGVITCFVANADNTRTDTISEVRFYGNGQPYEVVGWRAWPEVLAPAGQGVSTATIHAKGLQYPFRAGDALTVSVTLSGGRTVERTFVLEPSRLILANLLPGPTGEDLLLYVRNDDSVAYELDSLLLNGLGFKAGASAGWQVTGGDWTIGADQVRIMRIDAGPDMTEPGFPLAIRLGAARNGGAYQWSCAGLRVVAAEFALGTWHSSGFNPDETYERGRHSLRKLSLNTVMGPGNPGYMADAQAEYNMKAMWNPGVNPEIPGSGEANVQAFSESPFIAAWFIDDEPDLGSRPVQNSLYTNSVFWRHGPKIPSYLNLASQKKHNRYGWFADIVSMDHYAAPGAPNIIPLTWVPIISRIGSLKESLEYTEYLKFNTEPRRMWSWAQLAADAGWNQQPTEAAIDYQFWAHIIAGAKGIQWFVAQTQTPQEKPDQWKAAETLMRQFAPVRDLCLYGEYSRAVETSTDQVSARALVGEEAMLIAVLNNRYTHQWLGSFFPIEFSSIPRETPYRIEFELPGWISPEEVYRLTPLGREPVSGWQDLGGGRYAIEPVNAIYDRTHVYVIGRRDTLPPGRPGNLRIPFFADSSDYVVSWQVPRDNFGVASYMVYYNDFLVDTAYRPIYFADTSLYDCGQGEWRIVALDGAGNAGPPAVLQTVPAQTNSFGAVITAHPGQVSVQAGEPAVIPVTTAGSGPVQFRWQVRQGGSAPWTGAGENPAFASAPDGSLDIPEVLPGMDGWQFRCIVAGICSPADTSGAIELDVLIPTAVQESVTGDIRVYPNPARAHLIVEPARELNDRRYTWIDALGREMAAGELAPMGNNRYLAVTGALPPGIYFLRLQTEAGNVLVKVILQ